METFQLEAIYLGAPSASYTSKKSNSLIQFQELQVLLNGSICKFSFKSISPTFDWAKLSQWEPSEKIVLECTIESNKYDHDKPMVVLQNVTV
jgi:hypothetical protein